MQRFGISRVATDNRSAKRALLHLCVASPGAALLLLSACAAPGAVTVSDDPPAIVLDAGPRVAFEAVSVPLTYEEQRELRTATPRYIPLMRVGETVGTGRFGQLYDRRGAPIADPAAPGSPRVCAANDFNALLPAHDALFLMSHFECQPGAIYVTELNQDAANHHLAPLWTKPVDLADVRGGSLHCAGDITPWGSLLSSEEYEPDARSPGAADGMAAYLEGGAASVNPYDYGWLPEVTLLNNSGASEVQKRLAMGRFSHELGLVMPDARTVYLSDDGTNGGLFLFVADAEGDLSSGDLYAARWEQTRAGSGGLGAADLTWVPLGHAREDEIALSTGGAGVGFADLFDAAEPEAGACPQGYASINAGPVGQECLRVRDGMQLAASRLETRRYAALQGATTELMKSEGLAWDVDRRRVYLALTRLSGGMTGGSPRDRGGPDHIQLKENRCGGILGLPIGDARPLDASGELIESDFVAGSAEMIHTGRPRDYAGTQFEGNTCDVDDIANPDNLTYIPGAGLLMVAEDTKLHVNNALWAIDLDSGERLRVMTAPLGGELSGLHWSPDIGGYGYLTLTVQNPLRGQEADAAQKRSISGYFGPF